MLKVWMLVILADIHYPTLKFEAELACEKAKQEILRDYSQGLKDRIFCFEVLE